LYLLSRFDVKQVASVLSLAKPGWMALAALLYIALFPLRGLRWAILYRDVKPISSVLATEVFLVGFMANNLMPARLGDVVRAFVLGKREKISVTTTFSNILLERVFDGLTVVGFLFFVLLVAPPEAAWVSAVGALMGLVFFGALAGAAGVAFFEEHTLRLVAWLTKPLPPGIGLKLTTLVAKLAHGFRPLRSIGAVVSVLGLSLVIWAVEVLVYWVAQNAFGLSIPLLGLALVMAILTLGITAPSAPGFVGVYEALVISAVGLYGISEPIAPAYAIAMHLIHYVPGTLLGLLATWKLGLKVTELRQNTTLLSEPPPPLEAEASR
jgi:uncharacterized protein (TIRG00374 family)